MKILLVSPKGPLYHHRGGIFRKSLRYAPLTLTTLAALVPPELGAQVELVDEGIEDVPADARPDLVGLTVITGNAPRAYALADGFRRRGVTVVLGGPHATLMPDEAQRHADAVVVGYAEQSWPRLLRDAASGQLRRRYHQGADFTLRDAPFPRRELLAGKPYLTTNVFEATRSCSHSCEFCVAPSAWGRHPYHRPVEQVVEDIRRHGARKLIFVDLNLIADPGYAASLFEALVPLRVKWFGLSTTLIARFPALMELMAASGCNGLLLGFESMDPDSLASCRKGFNSPEHYAALVEQLHGHDISVMGCFVFGLDQDTPGVFDATARFADQAGIDLPRYAIATPFPGTPFHRRLAASGRILTDNWELYDGQHVVFRPSGMSVEQLQHGHERAWRHSYSLASMGRRLARSRRHLSVGIPANLGYRFYARRLHRFYTCDWFLGQGAAARWESA